METLRDLARLGWQYDRSAQDDDWPYVMAGDGLELVELPIAEHLQDATLYAGCHTHDRVGKGWRGSFMRSTRRATET